MEEFLQRVTWRKEELDENQMYKLLRMCVIAYFAKGEEKLMQYGYQITDFQPTMKFLEKLYYESYKRKVDAQCLNQ